MLYEILALRKYVFAAFFIPIFSKAHPLFDVKTVTLQ